MGEIQGPHSTQVKPSLQPGARINLTYTVDAFVGAGAFASVYAVRHRFLGRQALKMFLAQPDVDVEAMLGEARLLVDLTHPNIVRVYDANVCEDYDSPFAFMTMELSEHGTLSSWLGRETRLPRAAVLEIGLQISSALATTHSMAAPLLHKDVKPSNILVFRERESLLVKVSDFGLAASLDPETRLCRSGGTLAFAPPEMAWGVADERTDVYSLGVTLYRALTGIHPFPLTSPEEVSATREFAHALTRGRKSVTPPSRVLLSRPDELDGVIMKALAFDMFDRYRNAAELKDALSCLVAPHDGV